MAGAPRPSTGFRTTSGRRSRTCGDSPLATSNTCAPSPRPGPSAKSCKRCLHKSPGTTTSPCWRRLTTMAFGSGTPPRRVRRAGAATCSPVQIESRRHERQGSAVTNFPRTLPPSDSDLWPRRRSRTRTCSTASAPPRATEREINQGIMERTRRFLLKMGADFAFVGRQGSWRTATATSAWTCCSTTSGSPVRRRRAQGGAVHPRLVGQMNLYLSAADDLMGHPDD